MSKSYRIGTRGSLLARAQASALKAQLEALTGDHFQLQTIVTEGDEEVATPLWQLEGKDFFTKELDRALLSGEVDLTVHSYKDLGHQRPEGIALGAVTERVYGEDILLLRQETVRRLPQHSKFIVGTSSPRRMANCESFLAQLLPPGGPGFRVEGKALRGNVNTRLKRLKEERGEYDAIVVALAGLERLAQSPASREELRQLLNDLNYMVLPSSHLPSAAAQGALGVEVMAERSDGGELEQKLRQLHHGPTARAVGRERDHFQRYGGGCHLAVGIQVEEVTGHFVHFQRGKVDGRTISENSVENASSRPLPRAPFFLGLPPPRNPHPKTFIADQMVAKNAMTVEKLPHPRQCSFVTSRHCLEGFAKTHSHPGEGSAIFSGGIKTWQALAQKGYWVNGSSDGMGHPKLHHYLNSQTMELLQGKLPLVTYTSRRATAVAAEAESEGEWMACYDHAIREMTDDYRQQVGGANSFFWTSYRQFEIFREQLPEVDWARKDHYCGLGKTFQEFEKNRIRATAFLNWEQFVGACLG